MNAIEFDPYLVLGLKNDPNTPLSVIKKKFYQLSLKYHPDKIESDDLIEDYEKIITAYNILRNDKLRKNYHQQYPLDHYHLKTKLNYENSSKKCEQVSTKEFNRKSFNREFLSQISDQDKNNIDLFVSMNMTPSDIDDQFKYLHPESKFDSNYIENKKSYDVFQQQLEKLEEKRRNDLDNTHPVKILDQFDSKEFNNQFNVNKNKHYHIIKYVKPVEYNSYENGFLIDDEKFTKEYELPVNPNEYIDSDKYINNYIIEPISTQEFMDQLEMLKKNRDNFKFEIQNLKR
uniref:J domain-containing protein n=1 Tax=viral metagenome TaxID=1070528 RepID=A0A6C0LZA5_9ZZZZ